MEILSQQVQVEVEVEGDDLFDLLPDAILLEIFNKIHDAKSLCYCISTCKRFGSLIPQTHVLHLTLPPHRKPTNNTEPVAKTKNLFKGFINKFILKPVQSLFHPKKFSCSHCDHDQQYLPNEILRNFKEIRSLRVELPKNRGDILSNSGDALLKWKADFGSQLESCVILAATNKEVEHHHHHRMFEDDVIEKEEEEEEEESYFTNDKLKLRVVWTISCLIAASARHHLLKQILSEHLMIRDAVISDGSKQGKICMQINAAMDSSSERTCLPALRMKMWYVPVLELPASGCVLKGATLVVIRPAAAEGKGHKRETTDEELAVGAFNDGDGDGDGEDEKCFLGEAVRKMIMEKKANYTLEMNPF